MKATNYVTEHLAMGLLNTEKPLVYGVLNTANYDVMGFVFISGDTSDCLEDVGCLPEDIEKADMMDVGGTMFGGWPEDRAIIIVKMKDDRFNAQQ